MPYFNPDEYNKLLSDIGQIKSKEDFTRVKQRLEEIASRGEIKLPYIQIN
jgi:tetrahydromethanopterin S-methyltransferase subunit G